MITSPSPPHVIFKPYQPGLYPIVENSQWVERVLSFGVTCVQLRIKQADVSNLKTEIKRSVSFTNRHGALLFINDYWDLALQLGAHGVHLGQDDLTGVDFAALHAAGLYVGISAYNKAEINRAQQYHPSYIACGPIYHTTSKAFSVPPVGLAPLKKWRQALSYPMVAIGGITLARLPELLQSGVQGIAVISAITNAPDPQHVTQQFLTALAQSS